MQAGRTRIISYDSLYFHSLFVFRLTCSSLLFPFSKSVHPSSIIFFARPALLYCTVQYCTYSTVLYCTVLYSTFPKAIRLQYRYCTVLCCTVLYGSVQYNTVPCRICLLNSTLLPLFCKWQRYSVGRKVRAVLHHSYNRGIQARCTPSSVHQRYRACYPALVVQRWRKQRFYAGILGILQLCHPPTYIRLYHHYTCYTTSVPQSTPVMPAWGFPDVCGS